MTPPLTQRVKSAYDYFRKPKVTILIIAVLLVLFVLGLFIPQRDMFVSRAQLEQWNAKNPVLSAVINSLKLNEIYTAPITIVFLALFFINLLVVIAHRIQFVLRRAYLLDKHLVEKQMESLENDNLAITIVLSETSPQDKMQLVKRASLFFRKRFWTVFASERSPSLLAVRNRFSPLGFLLFHISFFLCLVGGLLVMYTRFSGNLTLTEGESFYADITKFHLIRNDPKIFRALPEFGITLLKVFPTYERATATDLNVLVEMRYFSENFVTSTKVNQPIEKGAISILPLDIGVSPLFILRKQSGPELQGGYFSLNVLRGREDSFRFTDIPYEIFVKFYADYTEENGVPATRSYEIKNPVFHLRVEKNGQILAEGLRKPGEPLRFEGLELMPGEIRHWADFLVVREYGTTPLFAGFFIGAAGLIMRLVFFQKTVRVHIGEKNGACILLVNGRSEYYQETYREELERVAAALAESCRIMNKEIRHDMD